MPDIFALADGHVTLSHELLRVANLPRREWTKDEADLLADQMTDSLRTPYGQMRLRPVQAVALYELGMCGGLFGPLRCGAGKTLISLLAPLAVNAARPLLLVPAKLVQKTQRDAVELRRHWRIPRITIYSYEFLGRIGGKDALDRFAPDLVIADECHRLRNRKASVTRRVRRFFSEHAGTAACVMSGTMTKRSIHDYARMLEWVFGMDLEKMPLPREWRDLELWADALDERKGQLRRADPGALEILCDEDEKRMWDVDSRRAARSAYRRRLIDTERVVATEESPIDATLTISEVKVDLPKVVNDAFEKLRTDWETPDGWPLLDKLEVYRHARELSIGFFYRWEPRPPMEWMQVRKAWSKFVREVLKHSHELDSELQVRRAHPDAPELREWERIKPTFEPNTVPVWLDDFALRYCAEWAKHERGIIWTEHVVFGEALEDKFGIPYYGRKGLTRRGALIDAHAVGHPLAASIQSNGEGRNLQAWSTNLITSSPANGKNWEQLLSRTHRDGQLAEEVQVDVLNLCAEHLTAFWQGVRDAEYVLASTGAPQKLLLAGKFFTTTAEWLRQIEDAEQPDWAWIK